MCWFFNLHASTLFRFWWHKRGWAGLKKTRQRQMSFGRCETKTWYPVYRAKVQSLPCLVTEKILSQKLKFVQDVELVEASNLSTACFKADGSFFQLSEVNSFFQLSKQSIPGHYGWLSTTHCWWKKATTEELCRPNALRCLETLHKLTIQGRGNFNMFETAFCIWSCLTTKEHLVAV